MQFIDKLRKRSQDVFGTPPLVAVFLGDSVTAGAFEIWEAADGSFDGAGDPENAYHAHFKRLAAQLWPNAPINIINAGVGGDNAPGGLSRLERDVLRYAPDLVVVSFGLNDVHGGQEGLPAYVDALRGIFTALQARGIETVFMTPCGMNTGVHSTFTTPGLIQLAQDFARITSENRMAVYMDAARALCLQMGVTLCDCHALWNAMVAAGGNPDDMLANHLNHPQRWVHALFAQELLRTLLYA